MAVVINEFEVLPDPQAEARKSAPEAKGDGAPVDKIEPGAVASAMRVLAVRALRSWAH